MKVFTVNMHTENAAFDDGDNGRDEIVRILRGIADTIYLKGLSGFYETIHDIDGNDVGRYALKNTDGSRP